MKKIILLCAGGMSTSVLVSKMKKAATAQGIEYEIDAYAYDAIKAVSKNADCILLGPQIEYKKASVEKEASCPVGVISLIIYGMMDGEKALALARSLMGEV